MLDGKNIHTKHLCKKLKDKMYGSYEVMDTRKNGHYCKLRLLDSWKIHPTFNICLMERYHGTHLKKQVVEIESDDAGWKMESIIASGPSDADPRKYVYLVKQEGYQHDENMWETYENVLESLLNLLKDYYGKNPAIEKDGRFGKRKR